MTTVLSVNVAIAVSLVIRKYGVYNNNEVCTLPYLINMLISGMIVEVYKQNAVGSFLILKTILSDHIKRLAGFQDGSMFSLKPKLINGYQLLVLFFSIRLFQQYWQERDTIIIQTDPCQLSE